MFVTNLWNGQKMSAIKLFLTTAGLLGALVFLVQCKQEVCIDKSKPELDQCKARIDKMQAEMNALKRTLAEALANPGTIKVDPSVLMIDGKLEQPKVAEGNISQEAVVSTLKMNKGALQSCYERAMKRNTSLHQQKMTVTLGFKLQPAGSASDISISPNYDAPMIDCMKKAIMRWHFPQFSGSPVGVETPVTLTPRR